MTTAAKQLANEIDHLTRFFPGDVDTLAVADELLQRHGPIPVNEMPGLWKVITAFTTPESSDVAAIKRATQAAAGGSDVVVNLDQGITVRLAGQLRTTGADIGPDAAVTIETPTQQEALELRDKQLTWRSLGRAIDQARATHLAAAEALLSDLEAVGQLIEGLRPLLADYEKQRRILVHQGRAMRIDTATLIDRSRLSKQGLHHILGKDRPA